MKEIPNDSELDNNVAIPIIGTQQREVLCRDKTGRTIPFKECMDSSRATIVPADRQSCVVDR